MKYIILLVIGCSEPKPDTSFKDDINNSILSENLVKNKLYDFIYFTEVMDEEHSTLFSDNNLEILTLAEKYKNE